MIRNVSTVFGISDAEGNAWAQEFIDLKLMSKDNYSLMDKLGVDTIPMEYRKIAYFIWCYAKLQAIYEVSDIAGVKPMSVIDGVVQKMKADNEEL